MIVALLQVRDVLRWEIYLKELIASSYRPMTLSSFARVDEYSAEVDNSNAPKIVRVYCSHHDSSKLDSYVMKVSFLTLSHP